MTIYILPHIRRFPFCKKDLSTTLEMTIRGKRYFKIAGKPLPLSLPRMGKGDRVSGG